MKLIKAGISMIPAPVGIRFVRAQLGLTQAQLAHAIGVSYATINRWERGKYEATKANREALESFCRKRKVDYETFQLGAMLLQIITNADKYTGEHCHRVAILVEHVARQIRGLNVDALKAAAILHDTGKIFVDPRLLKSKRIYNATERKQMAEHSPAGGVLIGLLMVKHPKAATYVARHHDRLTGKPSDRMVPREARLLAVCDVFDALTTTRSYKTAKSVKTAIEMLKADKGLDQQMVAALARCVRRKGFLDRLEDDNHLYVYDDAALSAIGT